MEDFSIHSLKRTVVDLLKLLIVDDNARIRCLIRKIVEPFACEVFECGNGEDALTIHLAQRPDVVLMDIRMNGMDGIQAANQIRAAGHDTVVLIVTNYDDEELRQAATDAGAFAYVLKDNLLDLVPLLGDLRQRSPRKPLT
ncbi:MAG TPA: response regulator [Bryobacteraceae bacterium]